MKVLVSSRGTILDLKKIVAKTAEVVRNSLLPISIHIHIHTLMICLQSCEEERQRIVYMGKELKNSYVVYTYTKTYMHTNLHTNMYTFHN